MKKDDKDMLIFFATLGGIILTGGAILGTALAIGPQNTTKDVVAAYTFSTFFSAFMTICFIKGMGE